VSTRKSEQTALAQLLLVGCAVLFGAFVLIEHAQAQQYVPPAPPPRPPVLNPSSPNTVPQPSYTPLAPSTPSTTPATLSAAPNVVPRAVPNAEVTPPVSEQHLQTSARSERRASVVKTHPLYHHRVIAIPAIYHCGWYGCVRTEPWAFPCQYYSTYCHPYPDYYRRYGWNRY
jgi:hypothetical protein